MLTSSMLVCLIYAALDDAISSAEPSLLSMTSLSWSWLDKDSFSAAQRSSQLSRPESWSTPDVDELTQLYDNKITRIIDRMLTKRIVRFRRRTSDPWFDDDCRKAKQSIYRLERAVRRADPADVAAATTTWKAQRREYRDLLQKKRKAFWKEKIDAERSTPRQQWRFIDMLMGRVHTSTSADVNADEMHRFFDAKVVGVRASTSDAPPLVFTAAPLGCVFRPLSIVEVVAAV